MKKKKLKKIQRKNSKKVGQKFEAEALKTLNSGAIPFDPGDIKTDEYVIEVKGTEKSGYRVSTKVLEKLWNQALTVNKQPLLMVLISNNKILWKLKIFIEKENK